MVCCGVVIFLISDIARCFLASFGHIFLIFIQPISFIITDYFFGHGCLGLHHSVIPCGFSAGFSCHLAGRKLFSRVCTMFIFAPQQGHLTSARFFGLGGLINTWVIS